MAGKRPPRLDLNPSAADRWTTCTASPQYILDNWDRLPPKDTAFSQEGTTAHEIAAALLQNRSPNVTDPYCCPVPPTAEMRWHAWNYAEYVQALIEPGGTLVTEKKYPLFYMAGRNAIVDAAIFNPTNLHIIDLKYGAGIVVSPHRSLQATIYAKCVLWAERLHAPQMADDFPITVHIYQPRGRAANDSPFHLWETTWGEVFAMASAIHAQALRILHKEPSGLVFAPSEKACQWCPAKGFCVARGQQLTEGIEPLAVIEPGARHMPPVKAVSLRQLAALVEHGDNIIKWIKDAQAYALDYMKAGHKIPGFKLVMSRGGNRYWIDEKRAAQILLKNTVLQESEVFERKVISVAQAEKLVGKAKFDKALTNLIGRPQGQAVIGSENDPRESAIVDPSTEFKPLDGAPSPELTGF